MAVIGEMRQLTIGGKTYTIPTYSLPIASSSTLGGIKVGSGLSIDPSTGTLTATGTSITIDTAMSDSSTNTVQNKVIKAYVDGAIPTKVSDLQNDAGYTTNTGTVTSVRVQATSPVQSSTSTAQNATLNTTISLADAYGDTKNPYGSKTKNYVLAAPSNAAGTPSFRALVASDIPDLSGTYLTSYTETDPTVPSWAKASSKPSYNFSEIGTKPTSISGYGITDAYTKTEVDTLISNLPEPMIFKGSLGTGGTITSLPTASAANEGFVYKVITAGTYASQSAKIGDTFVSDGSSWVLIPSGDEPSGTVTSITLTQGTGISISNSGTAITTSGTRTISHGDTSSQASSSNSGRTYIQSITLDDYGHVTGLSTATETVTNTDEQMKWTASTSSNTYYPLQSTSTATTSTANTLNSVSFYQYYNTAGGYRRLILGNTTAYTSSGGAYGTIRLYGTGATYYGDLNPGTIGSNSLTANRTWTLPNATGTIALTSDIPTIPTNVSAFTNDAGYLTSYTETDPTVPSWAKASSKPSYTASEVGALASNTTYVSTITTTAGAHTAISSKSGTVSFNVPTTAAHVGAATSDHVHGNITNDGDITATAPTIASGDQIIINDHSASKITNGPTFDGSTTSKYLSQKGTWESLPQGTAYSAGTGLSLSGTTFNHSNSVTAQTTQAVYPIKIDAQGHISAYGTAVTIVNTRGTAASGGTTLSVVNTGDMYTWNNKQDKATTLAGYGITDAKIANGTITLGSNTITPLTSFTESDPVFAASAAYGISSSDITNWNSKTSNTGTVTSVRVQATSPVQSSTSAAQAATLDTTISLASGYGDTQNPYGSKTANYVLAAPNGSAGAPSFRAIVAADLPVASSTAAGIMSTSSQYFGGRKYFQDGIYIGGYKAEDSLAEYGVAWFRSPSYTTRVAAIQANVLGTTGYRSGTRFSFFQYSYTADTTTSLSYYDCYRFPAVAAGKTANSTYNILNSGQASRVFVQSTAPASGMAANDIWIDTSGL